jgi:hypothetical protein
VNNDPAIDLCKSKLAPDGKIDILWIEKMFEIESLLWNRFDPLTGVPAFPDPVVIETNNSYFSQGDFLYTNNDKPEILITYNKIQPAPDSLYFIGSALYDLNGQQFFSETQSDKLIANPYQKLVKVSDQNLALIWNDNRASYFLNKCIVNEPSVYAKLYGTPSSYSNEVQIPKPNKLNIFPNPFNPNTTIRFNLPESHNVSLSIYNLKGQKVKTILKNKTINGEFSYTWNGLDDNENHLASGVYFCNLKTNFINHTKKILLLK